MWFKRTWRLKIILSRALAALLFSEAKPFMQVRKESVMVNTHVKLYEIWTVVQMEMSFTDISYLEFCQPICLVVWNHLNNFGRRHLE